MILSITEREAAFVMTLLEMETKALKQARRDWEARTCVLPLDHPICMRALSNLEDKEHWVEVYWQRLLVAEEAITYNRT